MSEKSILSHIDLEITRDCNLDCFHCSAGIERMGIPLDIDAMYKIVSEGVKLGVKKIGFTGGEPFYNDFLNLKKLTEHSINEYNLKVHVHSNGSIFSQDMIDWVAKKNLELTITLFSSDESIHETITRQAGSFKKTMDGIIQLLDNNVNVCPFIVPMKENIHNIPSLIKKLYEIGCEDIRILALSPTGRALDYFLENEPSIEEKEKLSIEINNIRKDYDISINAGFCTRLHYKNLEKRKDHDYCYAAQNRVHIDAYGNVFPCTASSGRLVFSAGNIHNKETPLPEIWNHSPLLNYIRKNQKFPDKKCIKCSKYGDCMGGCRVFMAYKHGDYSIANPNCLGPY